VTRTRAASFTAPRIFGTSHGGVGSVTPPKGMPPKKRRGSGWEKRPARHSTQHPPHGNAEKGSAPTQNPAAPPVEDAPIGAREEKPRRWTQLRDFAVDLWSDCYAKLFAEEDAAAAEALGPMPQTNYRRGLKGAKAQAYDDRAQKRQRKTIATHVRQANVRHWTFSVVARSLSWFNQRVPHRVWADACAERMIASRPACVYLLEAMKKVEPAPEFVISPWGFVLCADQTYCWQGGASRGS